jgi:arylsulfatase A-like enzyme
MAARSSPLVVLSAVLGLCAGCVGGQSSKQPNVILIVIDTLRTDRLGAYGGARGLTPFLDGLAGRGVRFERAYATSSWTCPSVASLLTSRYPSQHHVTTIDSVLRDSEVTIAEILAESGYVTVGMSGNLRLDARFGYAQGFRRWGTDLKTDKLGAAALRHRALARLDRSRRANPGRPVFLYLQYMDPHSPYAPPAPFRRRFDQRDPRQSADEANRKLAELRWQELTPEDVTLLESLYDGEVAYLDSELAQLFRDLDARGLLADSVVLITADHGEEFGEHLNYEHGFSLFDTALRVPLLVLESRAGEPRVVSDPVSLVDVAPTILALTGAAAPPPFEGRSLVPLMGPRGAGVAAADVLAELPKSHDGPDWRAHERAIVRGRDKLATLTPQWAAHLGDAVLYDPVGDPTEQPRAFVGGRAGASTVPEALALLESLRERFAALAKRQNEGVERAEISPEMRERLRALGYAL